VATEVVKSGERVPALKLVTVPVPTVIVQVEPSVQVWPLTVVAAFASAEFGIAEAETESVGVVVEVATLGTSHVGQEPLDATKFVT